MYSYLTISLIYMTFLFSSLHGQSVEYDRQTLKQLTEFRALHRKTVDGRLCAAAFVQDDETFTDCTRTRNPDGAMGRDWCYVEVQLLQTDKKDWDFCQSPVNFDILRSKAIETFLSKERNLHQIKDKVQEVSQKLQNIIEKFGEVCRTEGGYMNSITEAHLYLRTIEHQIQTLKSKVSRYELLTSTSNQVEVDSKYFLKESLKAKENCEAVAGYETELKPDGLRGSVFNNALFKGHPAGYRDDTLINFLWVGEPPLENLQVGQFSIRWDGWLLAPITSDYTFEIQADCGARLFLDSSPIITARMPEASEEVFDAPVKLVPFSGNYAISSTESQPKRLIGGMKYRIRLEYFHLSSRKWKDPDHATIKLLWKKQGGFMEVIGSEYFFKGNSLNSLKLSGSDPKSTDVSFLYDGVHAFVDSVDHFVADVPAEFEGKKMLRMKERVKSGFVSFSLNVDTRIYLAVSEVSDKPVSGTVDDQNLRFEKTGKVLSVYESSAPGFEVKNSEIMAIYYSDSRSGKFLIETPTGCILFFEQLKQPLHQCPGEPIVLSKPGNGIFESCETSSAAASYGCEAALSGRNLDEPNSAWHSASSNGIGEFISIKFKHRVEVFAVQFKPRDDPLTIPTVFELQFDSPKEKQRIAVNPTDSTYQIKPMVVQAVLVKVVSMKSGSRGSDTGGSLSIIGTPCEGSHTEEAEFRLAVEFKGTEMGFASKSFAVDNGYQKLHSTNGSFGWQKPAVVLKPSVCIKTLKHIANGGITFQPLDCINKSTCQPNEWSAIVPHYGLYKVIVKVGSLCNVDANRKRNLHCLEINGIVFIQKKLRYGQFAISIGIIQSSPEGHVVIRNRCFDSSFAPSTVIDSVVIESTESLVDKIRTISAS